ncbi:MAG: PEGA domain-containing protein [Kofleriaceae bacterium]
MTRAFSSVCLALVLIAAGASSALAKTKLAILGLEVTASSGGKIDEEVGKVAKDLTGALRKRVDTGATNYQLVKDGEKELVDEKLMNSCESEKADCMAQIGAGLGADVLIYGKIEKQPGKGYQVSLKLLRVNGKAIESWAEPIQARETGAADLARIAKKGFAALTNENTDGWLVVKTNIDRGTVLINDKEVGTLSSGTARINDLPEGRHTLAIEPAEGTKYARWEDKITITAGKATERDIELKQLGPRIDCDPKVSLDCGGTVGDGGKKSSTTVWKGVMIGGIAIGAAGAGYWVYNFSKLKDFRDQTHVEPPSTTCIDNVAGSDACDNGKKASTRTWIGGGVAVGGVVIATIGLLKAYVFNNSSESSSPTSTVGRQRKKRQIAITPIVAPDGGGATFRLDW